MKWIIMLLEFFYLNSQQGRRFSFLGKKRIILYVNREPPFGYETAENIPEIKGAILKGITEEHLKKITNKELRTLIGKLLEVECHYISCINI